MNTPLRLAVLLSAGAAVFGCSSERTSIGADGVYFGQLSMTGPQLDDGSQFATHTIELAANEELDVILQSSDFDAYLRIEDSAGNLLGEDDDSAGGTNAQLVVVAPQTDTYTLIASAFTAEEYGDYLLAVRRSMTDGSAEIYSGVLPEIGGKTLNTNAWPTYEVSATTGERLELRLTSAAFDAYLELRDAAGNVVAEDDDSGGGTNALLSVPVLRNGTYTMVVRSFDDEGSGNYTLSVKRHARGASVDGETLERFSGRLSAASPVLDDGTPYEMHVIEAHAGDQLEITMQSDDFDAFVHLWSADEHNLGGDDDSGGGLSARLNLIVPTDGRYLIVANSVGEAAEGPYDITLRRTSIEAARARGNVEMLTGWLSRGLGVLADGTPMAEHEIQARAGERFKVSMSAGEFDAYLVVFDSDDNKIGEDDDSGGGTNAQLSFVAPRDGTYRIAANSYGTDADGAYTIMLERN